MVDAVASLGCMAFDMDDWGVDVAMSGSQKGLMAPPGLGFVAANRPCARGARKRRACARLIGTGPTVRSRTITRNMPARRPNTCLFGLRQALDMLFEEGMENAFRRHPLLAEAMRRAVGVWAEGQALSFNIIAPEERCDTVSVVLANGHDPDGMRAYCDENCGVVLGHGIGDLSGKAFRIAHMGHVNAPMVLGRSVSSKWLWPLWASPMAGRRTVGDRLARPTGEV